MEQKTETFRDILHSLVRETRPLMTVFDDFVTMMVDGSTCGLDLDRHADLTLTRYSPDECRQLKTALELFQVEFENRQEAGLHPDILGDFYEANLGTNGVKFLPWDTCIKTVENTKRVATQNRHEDYAAADPCCGSGRLLLAHLERFGSEHLLLGIDPDPLCVKMTALNLFLKGGYMGEVLCADIRKGDDHFVFSYRLSLVPFGLIRISEREESKLWHLNRDIFSKQVLASDIGSPTVSFNRIRLD